jgi:hypothetical protein
VSTKGIGISVEVGIVGDLGAPLVFWRLSRVAVRSWRASECGSAVIPGPKRFGIEKKLQQPGGLVHLR